jgi:hypothetical protein
MTVKPSIKKKLWQREPLWYRDLKGKGMYTHSLRTKQSRLVDPLMEHSL